MIEKIVGLVVEKPGCSGEFLSYDSYWVTTKCQELCFQPERKAVNSTHRVLALTELGSLCKRLEIFTSMEL